MKRILYTLLVATIALTGCKKSGTIAADPNNNTPINIGLAISGASVNTDNSRSLTHQDGGSGIIMTEIKNFGETSFALYGVVDNYGQQSWQADQRIISTKSAKVETGSTGSYINYGERSSFPSYGSLSLYSIYPQPESGSPIIINDAGGDTPPSADITIGATFAEQYDILHSALLSQTVASATNMSMNYTHVMAQLNLSVMRNADAQNVTGILTKVTVEGYNKGHMPSITNPSVIEVDKNSKFTFVAYNNPTNSKPIDYTPSTITDGRPLLLLPGKGVVTKVIMTVDGQEFYVDINEEWNLQQGKKNMINIKFNKLSVQQDAVYEVGKWDEGTGHEGSLENNGRMLSMQARLHNENRDVPASTPTFMDIMLEGRPPVRGVKIAEVNSGLMTTERFNTGVIHGELITITGLIFKTGNNYDSATTIFEAVLNNNKTVNGYEILIDHKDNGIVKLRTDPNQETEDMDDYSFNLSFGGFGDGTLENPFEVYSAQNFKNINKFPGTTTANNVQGTFSTGAYFVQVADINVGSHIPFPLNSGGYDGNGYILSNIRVSATSDNIGLFSQVSKSNVGPVVVKNIYIDATSEIKRSSSNSNFTSTGSIVGYLSGGQILNSVNYANVVTPSNTMIVGGLAGKMDNGAIIKECANYGTVSGFNYIGGITGQLYNNGEISDTYNHGTATLLGTTSIQRQIGGIIGQLSLASTSIIKNNYNVALFEGTSANDFVGGIIGSAETSGNPVINVSNNRFLDTAAKGVGQDQSANSMVSSNTHSHDENYFKQSVMVNHLNDSRISTSAPWALDNNALQLANGFPVLKWLQTHKANN